MTASRWSIGIALALVVDAPRESELTFGPAQGARLTKNFEVAVEVKLEEFKQEMDGEDFPSLGMEGQCGSTTIIRVTDHYRAMDGGRPAVLARTFDELARKESLRASSSMGASDTTTDLKSALQGTTVVFSWNEANSLFEPQYEGESKPDAELLEQLVEDMDLRALLPGMKVAEGDSWKIDAKHFAGVIRPGGNFAFRSDKNEEGFMASGLLRDVSNHLAGDASATFRGFRQDAVIRVAVIEVAAKIETWAEREQERVKERLEVAMELDGELLWDVAATRAKALTLNGPMRVAFDRSGEEEDYDDETYSFAEHYRLGGTTKIKASWNAE